MAFKYLPKKAQETENAASRPEESRMSRYAPKTERILVMDFTY
jgi:hypothetical protein